MGYTMAIEVAGSWEGKCVDKGKFRADIVSYKFAIIGHFSLDISPYHIGILMEHDRDVS